MKFLLAHTTTLLLPLVLILSLSCRLRGLSDGSASRHLGLRATSKIPDEAVDVNTINTATTPSSFSTHLNSSFFWGVATAAYQIEGGADSRGRTIWDSFKAVANGDVATVADDSYYKMEEDLALIKALGVNSYRFSLSWARLFPNFGSDDDAELSTKPDTRGISYYNCLINRLLELNIEPIVTIYHWDLPESLHLKYGGWLSRQIVNDFAFYAEFCFKTFGDRVKHWATMNEPWTFIYMGYGTGYFAPGRCSDRSRCKYGNSSTEVYIAGHNVLLAHAEAVYIYRSKYQQPQSLLQSKVSGTIGIVLNLDWGEPLTSSDADLLAADRHNEFGLAWFADPIYFGKYPDSMVTAVGHRLPTFSTEESEKLKGSVDFLGLNHYSSKYYSSSSANSVGGWAEDQQNVESKHDGSGNLIGLQADSNWLNVVPWGFFKTLVWVSQRYKSPVTSELPLIIVTENGCDVPSESSLPLYHVLQDTFRIHYLDSYISEMKRALSLGLVNVKGYMVWSLLDNFEWVDGYSKRFGLHYVDYSDPNRKRIAKMSASWYQNYILNEGLLWPYNRTASTTTTSTATTGKSSRVGSKDVGMAVEGRPHHAESRSLSIKVASLLLDAYSYNYWPLFP